MQNIRILKNSVADITSLNKWYISSHCSEVKLLRIHFLENVRTIIVDPLIAIIVMKILISVKDPFQAELFCIYRQLENGQVQIKKTTKCTYSAV